MTQCLVTSGELETLGGRTILITGAGGMLGGAFCEALDRLVPTCHVVALDRVALDVTNRAAVLNWRTARPDVILHCAADVDADRCERDPERCRAVQVGGTENVIALAQATGAKIVYPQSVFIFDGRELPVTEETEPAPMSVYGRYKLAAERALSEAVPDALIIRMAGFFGGEARDKNFVGTFTRALFELVARGDRSCEVGERIWQPSYTRDLAENILLLLALNRCGTYHMGSYGEASFYQVARACVEDLGFTALVTVLKRPGSEPASRETAPRPFRMVTANGRLGRERLDRQRHWRVALHEYLSGAFFQEQARTALQPL
jgi:dTDP-4-dehydrorhamnose reductase